MEVLEHKLKEQQVKEKIFESKNKVDVKREELRKKREKNRGEFQRMPEFSDVLFGPEQVSKGGEKRWTPK